MMSEELILEKVDNIEKKVDRMDSKFDNLINPKDGTITEMQKFQASCPRKQFKWIWLVIIPFGVANIALTAAAIAAMVKLV